MNRAEYIKKNMISALGCFRQRVKRGAAAMCVMRQMCLLNIEASKPVLLDTQTTQNNVTVRPYLVSCIFCNSSRPEVASSALSESTSTVMGVPPPVQSLEDEFILFSALHKQLN